MSKLVYLFLIYLTSIKFIQAIGNDTKIWSNEQNDKLKCTGFEWHSVIDNENFFKDLQLTKNVFDYYSNEKSQFKIDPDIVKKKIKDLPLEYLVSIGYSLSIYVKSDGSTKASYLIEHESEKGGQKKNLIEKDSWQTISGMKEYKNEKELNIDDIVKFIFNIKVTGNQDKSIYFAVSNLYKYLKFKIKNDDNTFKEEEIYFYFNKGTLEYQVRIDDKLIENLNDFDHWTSLNFEGVLKNNLKHIAVSKFHSNLMMLEFKINDLETNFENSSICVKFKYYHDNGIDDDLPTFEILTKMRGSKDDDENKIEFNKLIDYIINSKSGSNNLEIAKNWLTLKLCFHKKYLKANVIYLMSNIKKESQKGHNPSLTNALADFQIERGVEHFNDFLYCWNCGLFNIEDEWYTTPILDNFKLIKDKETKQTYLELINEPTSKINVYHLISNAFEIVKDAKLIFRLKNNHTEGTLKIYLIEDTKSREKIAHFQLSDIQDSEKYIIVNITKLKTDNDPNSAATFTAVDVEDDDEEEISDYKNILQNINLNIEKSLDDKSDDEKKEDYEKGEKENDDKGDDKKDGNGKEKSDNDKKKHGDKDDKSKQTEKSFAKLIFEFKLKRLEKDENLEQLQLLELNLGDPCQLKYDKCRYGTCISHTSKKWSCKCDENAHGPNCEFKG